MDISPSSPGGPAGARVYGLAVILLCLCGLSFAAGSTPEPYSRRAISYVLDVKPVLERKCIACHGCYDAPCQLKLTSSDGLARGATKKQVYDATRLRDAAPTRLFIDAQTTAQWRDKGFFDVLKGEGDHPDRPLEQSLLFRFIELGRRHPLPSGEAIPKDIELGLSRENTCPDLSSFDDYAGNRPMQGMPLAIAGLTDGEYGILRQWIATGARIDELPRGPTPGELRSIGQWERFLNQGANRNRLVARYLYEHWYLAHLYFEDLATGNFFHLVRSSTPPGEPLREIPTARPNDDPGGAVFYRFRKITGTIVHKTHIVYPLSDARLERVRELFLASDWDVKRLPDYSTDSAINPFRTFAAIPARARYRFMLDDAHYFVMTFIRGPVCRGQVATNVIDDHFHTLFQDPDHDLSVTDAAYLERVTPYLALPGLGSAVDAVELMHKRNEYIRIRGRRYRETRPGGPGLEDIWDGDGDNTSAVLTVFRHFDNATVVRGFAGGIPKTLWVLDYPLFERTYYELVVNFNVFGRLLHLLDTRQYFDLLRTGAENNFLRFMPAASRKQMRDAWYRGPVAQLLWHVNYVAVNDDLPTRITYRTGDPKTEFVDLVAGRLGVAAGRRDVLNRCDRPPCNRKGATARELQVEAALQTLAAREASEKGMRFVRYMPDLVFLRVRSAQGDLAYTLVRNKAHANVAFMPVEEIRREPQKDTITLYPGLLGSYPNFIMTVSDTEVGAFTRALHAVASEQDFLEAMDRWGVRRTHPAMWENFHWFVDHMKQTRPVQAGVYDLNRYKRMGPGLSED